MKPVSFWKRQRYRLEVALVSGLNRFVPLFPRQAVHALGRTLGRLAFYLSPASRRIALANLDIAFGDTKSAGDKVVIARKSFQNFVATLLSLFWTPRLSPQTVQEVVEVDEASLQHVREIRARGQGIIFITLHYGDWELLGQTTGYYGIPLTIVMEQMRNAALGEVFARLRAHSGHRVIPQRSAAMKLIKTLKRGESVAMLVDLNAIPGDGGVWLDFFGLPVYNHASAAALALHSGAAIVLGVAHPLGAGRVRAVYGPEIKYTLTGNHTNDLQTISQQCLAACEQVIREHPEHWLWSYRRWKFRPTIDHGQYPFYSRFIGEVGRHKAASNADHSATPPQQSGP